MSITTVPSVVTGQTYSAANYNTQVRDNINGIWVCTTAGDMIYATGASAAARLALVTGGIMYGGASAPAWLAKPASVGILKNTSSGVPSWITGGNAYDVLRRNAANTDFEFASPALAACVTRNSVDFGYTSGMIAWDTDVLDTPGWHNPSTNNSRITVAKTGVYVAGVMLTYYEATGGTIERRVAQLHKNGSTLTEGRFSTIQMRDGISGTIGGVIPPLSLTAGDYIEASASISGPKTIIADYSRMWLMKIG